jgi:hypothetical protein
MHDLYALTCTAPVIMHDLYAYYRSRLTDPGQGHTDPA